MSAKQSIKNPKDRGGTPVKTEEPSKLRPERSKTDVNCNAATTNIRAQPPYIRPHLPYKLNEILREADSPQEIDRSSRDRLYKQPYHGVHHKQNKRRYWIDRTNKANCFMLYAEGLSITWGEDNHYWNWVNIKETSDEKFLAAELKCVRWLEVCGKFDTAALTPETLYEVVFVVKVKEDADGLESITLRLIIPNKSSKDVTVNLMNVTEREKWIEVLVGEFFTSSEFKRKQKRKEIEIFLYETENLNCKQGLVIKGIVICPKESRHFPSG